MYLPSGMFVLVKSFFDIVWHWHLNAAAADDDEIEMGQVGGGALLAILERQGGPTCHTWKTG